MTPLEKIDRRIDRAILRRNAVQDKVAVMMRQLRNREKYIAFLGKLRSEQTTGDMLESLQPLEETKMKSKDKLIRYRSALSKFYIDSAKSKALNLPPPIHKPTREDYEINRPEEIFIAERIEKDLTPKTT